MQELQKYIHSYFQVSSPEELAAISAFFKPEIVEKGDHFLRSGSRCTRLSFIRKGLLRIYAGVGHREVTQWISGPGSFVTDLSAFMFETPARFGIHALSEVELFSISRDDYKRIGSKVPHWHEIEKLFLARCFTVLEERVLSHLSMSAAERYEAFFEKNRELFNQVPLQYLASMLGMSPETFSRIRKDQQKGIS